MTERIRKRKPTHPCKVFLEDVLRPLDISITEAADKLGITRKHLSNLCNGHARLTPEVAVRIAMATNTSTEGWLDMQNKLDLWELRNEEAIFVEPFCEQQHVAM